MSESDFQLLSRYGREGSEEAFAEVVRRYLDLVYSAALRQVRSRALAEEVAQAVFVDLVRNINQLSSETVLAAWLYEVTRRTAIDVVRSESRRSAREKIVCEMNTNDDSSDPWDEIRPVLDEGMSSLSDTDRVVVLLRYFEGRSLREVGQKLGLSEGAAQKRVSRAVERLRAFLVKRNIPVDSASLVGLVSTKAVHVAPVGLALAVSSATTLAGTTSTMAAIQTITMTTIQKTILASSFTLVIGAGIYQNHLAANLRDDLAALRSQTSAMSTDLEQARDQALSELADARNEAKRLRGELSELPKLRGELAKLRSDSKKMASLDTTPSSGGAAARDLIERVSALKDQFDVSPEAWIPELELVTEEDWIIAASGKIDSDVGIRRAMSRIRSIGEGRFAELASEALRSYLETSNDEYPVDMSELAGLFEDDVNAAVLDRWMIAESDVVPNVRMGDDYIITQKEPVDDLFDQRHVIGSNGRGSTDFFSSASEEVFSELSQIYQDSNNGQRPNSPSELLPYVRTPEDQKVFDNWLLKNSLSE